MTNEKQTLSDKIVALGEDYLEDENYPAVIGYKDVKDFIKKLKEEIKDDNPTDPRQFMICQADILEIIDKLAGDKLI